MGHARVCLAAWLFAAFLSGSAIGADAEPRLHSGIFEGMMLAVDPHGAVTGYYRQDQGEGVQKRCAFFLAGSVTGGETPIVTWSDRRYPGTLVPWKDGVKLRIEQGREHGGCGLVLLPQISSGLILDQIRDAAWDEVRTIAIARAHFHSAPDVASKKRSFLVAGDVVGVLTDSGDWLEVEYSAKGKMTKGWLRASATRKLVAPSP